MLKDKFTTLNINDLGKNFFEATTLIRIDQYNTGKQNLEKKIDVLIKKIPDVSDLATTTVLNTKIGEVENRILVVSGVVKSNAKVSDIEKKSFSTFDYNKFT